MPQSHKFKSPENDAKIAFSEKMKTFIQQNSTNDCQIAITGMPFVDVTMDNSLIKSQLGSIIIAIIFVILIVGVNLKSLKGAREEITISSPSLAPLVISTWVKLLMPVSSDTFSALFFVSL